MTDEDILALYFKRSEEAIKETNIKYGNLCRKISGNILKDERDSEECVNDTWLALWNAIPPKKPNPMKAYVCRITKNLALKRYQFNHAGKRYCEYELSLDELADCVSHDSNVHHNIEAMELSRAVNCFLDQLSAEKRILFVRRYWFLQPVKEIAADYHITADRKSVV